MSNSVSTPANQADNRTDERLETIAKDIETTHTNAVLHIAAQLAEARDIFRYRRDEGGFGGWVETRLRYSRSKAYNLLSVHERFGGEKNLSKWLDTFPAGILYALAAPSTPETARAEIIKRAQSGEVIPISEVRRTVDAAKGRKLPAERARAWYREAKLGEDTVEKLRGTCLASAREQDDLVLLNRGAPEGEHTPIVKQLVADAVAGKNVSAIEVMNNGVPPSHDDDGESDAVDVQLDVETVTTPVDTKGREQPAWRPPRESKSRDSAAVAWEIAAFLNDVADSPDEITRKRARLEELEIENAGLRSEVEDLRGENADLQGEVDRLNARIRDLENAAPAAADGLDISATERGSG